MHVHYSLLANQLRGSTTLSYRRRYLGPLFMGGYYVGHVSNQAHVPVERLKCV